MPFSLPPQRSSFHENLSQVNGRIHHSFTSPQTVVGFFLSKTHVFIRIILYEKTFFTFFCSILKVTDGLRTHNQWNHNPLLCQLSYGHNGNNGIEPSSFACLQTRTSSVGLRHQCGILLFTPSF